jgi:tRNA1(Val) A37 N6-methylase TrmN6
MQLAPSSTGDPARLFEDICVIGNGETAGKNAIAVTDDALFAGDLKLLQPKTGHRAGTDAVLLAAATPPEACRIADLGASTGLVGLRAAQMNPQASTVLIERDVDMARLATENAARNGLSDRVAIRQADAFALAGEAGLREAFDVVLTNPPFFKADEIRVSPNSQRAGAHVLEASLDDWMRNATTILAPKGQLLVIHRADALGELLAACARRIGGVRLRFIHPDAGAPAIRVLLAGRKGSCAPLSVLPPLILHGAGGAFVPEVAALHRGEARLDMTDNAQKKTGGKSRPS